MTAKNYHLLSFYLFRVCCCSLFKKSRKKSIYFCSSSCFSLRYTFEWTKLVWVLLSIFFTGSFSVFCCKKFPCHSVCWYFCFPFCSLIKMERKIVYLIQLIVPSNWNWFLIWLIFSIIEFFLSLKSNFNLHRHANLNV